MKNQAMNTSAKRNTLAATVVAMVANGDTITPEHKFKCDEIAETKAAQNKRNADVKQGAKNEQANNGTKKGATTRVKAGKIDVSKLLTMSGLDANPSWTTQDECDYIRDVHNRLVSGQMQQLDAFIAQGAALVRIKSKLVQGAETEKAADRAFGNALKQAGIGADIIPRDVRGCYVWLAENEQAVRQFVDDALNTLDESATKEQKSIARKFKAVKLSPYIIKAAMSKETKASNDTPEKALQNFVDRMEKMGISVDVEQVKAACSKA